MLLEGKKVILAVTGSIAAYKAAYIIRLLKKKGALVRVIMTEASSDFITPITLGTLSKEPVIVDFVKEGNTGEWNNHVDLGLWADLMLIAPATANTLAKMVSGHADSFLLATYLSARCPVFIAPAMDLDMFTHGSTQDNLKTLMSRGNYIIEPESGELASGLDGKGRLAEPENIVTSLENYFKSLYSLAGKNFLVSAGPTFESIDPVRFIGNRSSGKMGVAIAHILAERGANVTLVLGPSHVQVSDSINTIRVESAQDMLEACQANFNKMDAAIMAAAVADFTPINVSEQKVKKKDGNWNIELKRTTDILNWMGNNKKHQKLVGFALETENELQNAQRKLEKKNLDFIVLNSLQDKGAGFQGNTNKVTFVEHGNKITNFELKSKSDVAIDIVNKLEEILND